MKILKKITNPFASKENQKEFQASPTCGLVSHWNFDSLVFWQALTKLFDVKNGEELAGVVIYDGFIKGKYENKKSPELTRQKSKRKIKTA